MKINQNKKALKKLLSCYIYIVPHCLQNPPLLQPENNHRPVNFPLLQHFPETRNVSQGNKPENANISPCSYRHKDKMPSETRLQKQKQHFHIDTKTKYKMNQNRACTNIRQYSCSPLIQIWIVLTNILSLFYNVKNIARIAKAV